MKQYNFMQFSFMLNTAPPPTQEDIQRAEAELGIIPDIYKAFLSYSNGANTDYVRLCDLSSMIEQHEILNIEKYLPGYICIGSENGDYELLMEAKADAATIYLVDAGAMLIDENTITLPSIYDWLLSGHGDDPGDPLGEDDTGQDEQDWDDWVDVVLIKLPSCGLKGFAHLKSTLKLPVSAAFLYQQSKSLPYTLLENIYRGNADRLVRQLDEPKIVKIVAKDKHAK